MVEVLKKETAHFRVIVKNVLNGKTASLSLTNNSGLTEEQIRDEIKRYFEERKDIKRSGDKY